MDDGVYVVRDSVTVEIVLVSMGIEGVEVVFAVGTEGDSCFRRDNC